MNETEAKLPLKRYRPPCAWKASATVWASCLPFVENTRGVLIHRPKSAVTYNLHREPHLAVIYYCGNGTSGRKHITFLPVPPEGALLCERCEQAALEAGLPSADALAGRHVHKGKIKAVVTCGCEVKGCDHD